MKTVTIYIASDGTEFDNEQDCILYENDINAILNDNNISFYDYDGCKIKPSIKNFEWYNSAECIYVKNQNGADSLSRLGDITGESTPMDYDYSYHKNPVGIYLLDNDYTFVCIDKKIEELKQLCNKIGYKVNI